MESDTALALAFGLDILGGAILAGTTGGIIHKADLWLVPSVRYADAVWQRMVAPRKS